MKKTVTFILLTTIISSQCIAHGEDLETANNQDVQATETITYMTIDDAYLYALENSLTIKSAESDIQAKRYKAGEALKTYRDLKNNKIIDVANFDGGLLFKGYYLNLANLQHDSAKRNLEVTKLELKNKIKSDIYTYFNNIEKEKIAKTSLENAEQKLGFQKTRLDSGLISKLDYEMFELSVLSAKNNLSEAKRNTEMSLITIKSDINFPIEKDLVIQGTFPTDVIEIKPADEAIKLSREQNTYITLTENNNIAKQRWDFAMGYYFPAELAFQVEKYTYETACADYQKNIISLDNGIRTTYNNLLNLQDGISYAEKYSNYLKKVTDVSYTRYEMGLITATDYVEAEQSYFQNITSLMDMKLAYRNAALSYKALYTLE